MLIPIQSKAMMLNIRTPTIKYIHPPTTAIEPLRLGVIDPNGQLGARKNGLSPNISRKKMEDNPKTTKTISISINPAIIS